MIVSLSLSLSLSFILPIFPAHSFRLIKEFSFGFFLCCSCCCLITSSALNNKIPLQNIYVRDGEKTKKEKPTHRRKSEENIRNDNNLYFIQHSEGKKKKGRNEKEKKCSFLLLPCEMREKTEKYIYICVYKGGYRRRVGCKEAKNK